MEDLYIRDEGKGFPLVFIHGFLGSSKMWEPQIKFFKKYYRVIAPDLPGFGNSNITKSFDSITSIAKILITNLEKKKIDKFNLLGHSMGGMVAQEMTKAIGDKIDRLVCYSTGPIGEMPGRFETIEASRKNFKNDGLINVAKKIAETWFIRGEHAKYCKVCIESGKQTSLEAVDKALIALKKWNGVENLKNIKNKTLIIWGDQDKSYNFSQTKILKENISNSKLIIFKQCAHNVHLERVNKFNKTILKFLTK
jgi:pimeloyl-ACP methyl ester carboxylesterase